MIIFFGLFMMLCFCSASIFPDKEGNVNYLSLQSTQTVKGIFIILVFFSHFQSYVTLTSQWDLGCRAVIGWFGQAMVSMFLFYSGFGVMESIQKKGRDYVNAMPKRRILATLFRFDCAVLLFAALALWRKAEITVVRFLFSLIGWMSLGNSNWYIFVILMLYLITWGAFKIFSQYSHAVLSTFIATCIGMFCLAYFGEKQQYWYDTALCYVMGMAYSLYRGHIEERLLTNKWCYAAILAGLFLGCVLLQEYCYTTFGGILRNCAFAAFMVVLTMRVAFRSRVLNWCGVHLFSLYILQRVPMIVFQEIGLADNSVILYFLCCVLGTVVLAVPFERITEKLWHIIQRQ